jgi:hypothetical protein
METLPQRVEPETFLEGIEPALSAIDHTSFSPAAFSALQIRVAQCIADLVDEAGKIGLRDRSDIISVKHVETGILLGACVSNLYSILTANQNHWSGTLLTVILGISGAAFLMMEIMGTERA